MGLGPKDPKPAPTPEAANETKAPESEIDWDEEPAPEWAAEGDRPVSLDGYVGPEEPVPPDKDWELVDLLKWDDPE